MYGDNKEEMGWGYLARALWYHKILTRNDWYQYESYNFLFWSKKFWQEF